MTTTNAPGAVIRLKCITRSVIRANPSILFAFGDNLARTGFGGQAAECRGEPNAVGIPTKRYPSMLPTAFFTDDDWPIVKPTFTTAFARLEAHLLAGKSIVWPTDGIGTGRARLAASAPRIAGELQVLFCRLVEISAG